MQKIKSEYALDILEGQVVLRCCGGSTCKAAGILRVVRDNAGLIKEVICDRRIHAGDMEIRGWDVHGAIASVFRIKKNSHETT